MIETKSENAATIIDVQGMTCANCAFGVENQLKKLGADDIKVNFALGEASFVAPKSISPDEIDFEATMYFPIYSDNSC